MKNDIRKITIKKFEKLLQEPESEYLDFKEKYSDKFGIIKDILAFSNSRTKSIYRFIIFGVSDDGIVKGLKNENRRMKQAEIINVLRNIPINKMPIFKLYTIHYSNCEIDILCIKNTFEQPYFLIKDYSIDNRQIPEGVFYERIGDANRIIANDSVFDDIYRRRFGLDKHPLEKAIIYLRDKNGWLYDYNEKNELFFYYAQYPEFIVLESNSEETEFYHEPWANCFPDSTAIKKIFFLKYHSTILRKFIGVFSDGARYLTISPKQWYYEDLQFGKNYLSYYYLKDSIEFYLNNMIQILFEKQCSAGSVIQRINFSCFLSEKHAERTLKKDLLNKQKLTYFYFFPGKQKYKAINFHKILNIDT